MPRKRGESWPNMSPMTPQVLTLFLAMALNKLDPDPTHTIELVLDQDSIMPMGRGLLLESDGAEGSARALLLPLEMARERTAKFEEDADVKITSPWGGLAMKRIRGVDDDDAPNGKVH